MTFVVKYRTEEEIKEIRSERQFWADRVKGMPDYNVCPIEIIMSDGTKVEVWDIKEEEIVSIKKNNKFRIIPATAPALVPLTSA